MSVDLTTVVEPTTSAILSAESVPEVLGAICLCLLVFTVWSKITEGRERTAMREEMLTVIKDYRETEKEQSQLMITHSSKLDNCLDEIKRLKCN